MRRLSSVVGFAALAIAALTAGCRVSVETKERFTLSSGDDTVKTDTADWNGEAIVIDIKGVGIAVNGGVKVIADPNVTKVTASTRFLAMAFEKADADLSIGDAIKTFTLTHSGSDANGEIRLDCGHGQSHGTSDSGSSGCEYVEVRVPAGDATTPLRIKTLSGNGTVTLQLAGATIGETLNGRRGIEGNSQGDTDADLPATPGAEISLVSEGDLEAKLPSNFAADTVILSTEDNQPIDVGPFTDIKSGTGAGGRGTAGTGLVELHLTARGLGEIKLRQ